MTCNRDDTEGRCNANDGEPCDACSAERARDMEHWARIWSGPARELQAWEMMTNDERDAVLRDAGRIR